MAPPIMSFPIFQTTIATTAQNRFSLALVQHIAQAAGTGNVAVSPLGIVAALALAMGGANGITKETFGEVLFGTTGHIDRAETAFAG